MDSFINLNSNDELSKMNKDDLKELIKRINLYNLELRENLNLDKSVTFGMELECEHVDLEKVKNALSYFKNWNIETDESLVETRGMEFISPKYHDEKDNYEELQKVCTILQKYATIGRKAGSHIHIGAHIIKNLKNLSNLINLWLLYEHVIFRFTNGEFLYTRPDIKIFAYPLREEVGMMGIDLSLQEYKRRFVDSSIRLCNIRSLTEEKYKNTIEFRSPNGTLEPIIWQNNLNFFVKLIQFSSKCQFDYKSLCEKILLAPLVEPNEYYKIFLKDAIELSDLIFDKNIDKIYFLRQYLKNYEISTRYIKCKRFIK